MPTKDIFISYRHEDSSAHAVRLADGLGAEFGASRVFLDAGIERGSDFRAGIHEALASCHVLIAVIGENWLRAQDHAGRRRLDDPADFVVMEIATALERDIRVIPVLVSAARMPSADDLPECLAQLAFRAAHELTEEAYDAQLGHLVQQIRPLLLATRRSRPNANAPQLASSVREELLDEIQECIGDGVHVAIGGPPGIGKTWLLNSLAAICPSAVHVHLEEDGTPAMRELRLALHGHYVAGEFPLDDEAGLDALRRRVPAETLLLIDNADELSSVAAVKRLTRFLTKLTVVVASRRAYEFREFRRVTPLPLAARDAEAIVNEYGLDEGVRTDVLRRGVGNPLLLRQHADTAKHGGAMHEEDPLRSMFERWPPDEEQVLWIIAELPSSILAQDLLVEVGGLTHAGLALLRGNAVVEPVANAPVRDPSMLGLHGTLRRACQQRLPTVREDALRRLRADIAAYYVIWLRGAPAIEAIDMTRRNLIHLMHALDDHEIRTELALELIGDHLEDPAGYLPARGLAGLLVEPKLRATLVEAAKDVRGVAGATLLKNLGLFCHWANDPDSELHLLSARELYDGLGHEEGRAATSWILGVVAEDTGLYAAAEALYRAPLRELIEPAIQAVSHHLVGCCLYRQERYSDARDEYERARVHARTPTMHLRIERTIAYVELADGDKRQALDQLTRIRARSHDLNRPREAARSLRHIGLGQLRLGDLAAADESLEQARDEFEKLGDRRGLGATLWALASTRRARGLLEDARDLAMHSRRIARGLPDEPWVPLRSPVGAARAEEELGEIARALDETDAADAHLRRACNIFEAIGHPRHELLACKLGDRRDAPIPLPRGIVFDLVDTLYPMPPDAYERVKRQISGALGVNHERFKAAWASSRDRASTDSDWTPADRIRWVARALGAQLRPERIDELAELERRLWTTSAKLDAATLRTLAELRERDIAMALVTNGSSAMRGLADTLGLRPLLRDSLLSCEVGVVKPRPGIYLKALAKLELPASDCIYVGDGSDRELEGAQAVGLFAVRMRPLAKPPYSTRESLDWDATVHSLGELVQRMGEDRA